MKQNRNIIFSSKINILRYRWIGKTKRILLKHLLNSLIIAIMQRLQFFLATGNHEEELEILNKILGLQTEENVKNLIILK